MDLDDYLLQHSDAEPDYLARINRKTHLQTINPRMLSGHLQGRALSMLSRMIAPKRILEIGAFTGYSALCLAEGLAEGGVLHTIESDDELEDMIRENIAEAGMQDKIVVHIGDALELLDTLTETFDLVFIDADKREYEAYYEKVLPLLNKGGFILADNTLWDGKVLLKAEKQDEQTRSIQDFNQKIANDQRISKVILPLRDGLTLMQKK